MINGVFTTIKIINSIPLFLKSHQQRLIEHTSAFHLPYPLNIENQIKNFIKQNKLQDSALRITITKDSSEPLFEHRALPPSQTNVQVITVSDTRDENKIYKTTDRTINDQARQLAKQQGAQDAIFVQNGVLIESTIANIFSLNQKGQLITPPIGGRGLSGITRQIIMEQTDVHEEEIPEITTAPLVLVNCLRISKVTHVDVKKLSDGEELLQRIKILLNKAKRGVAGVGVPVERLQRSEAVGRG